MRLFVHWVESSRVERKALGFVSKHQVVATALYYLFTNK